MLDFADKHLRGLRSIGRSTGSSAERRRIGGAILVVFRACATRSSSLRPRRLRPQREGQEPSTGSASLRGRRHAIDGVGRLPGLRHRWPRRGEGPPRARIVVCGTGSASRWPPTAPGVRAAVAYDEETARLSREHNDANVLALGSRSLDHGLAERILECG